MQHVGAYLRAPFYLLFLPLQLRLLLLALLELDVIEAGFEDAQGVLAVVLLTAGLGVLHHDARGDVAHAHAGLHLVHVLAAVAAGTEGIPFYVGRIDFDVDGVVHQRIHEHRRECGLALALGVEGRDAHQSVHSALRLEVAVGIVALELDGGALDAGLISLHKLGHGHLVAVALAPAHIHAHQHRTPVVGFGAACAGIDGEHRSEVVALLAEHVLELEILQFLQCIGIRRIGVGPFRVQLH